MHMRWNDEITAEELQREVSPFYGIRVFPALDSTNTWLMEHADLPEGTVVIADGQSAGRGRNGRAFHSPAGCGIYLSVLLKPDSRMAVSLLVTAAAAAACAQAAEEIYGVSCQIKWLNDVLCGGRKIAGILCEGRLRAGSDVPSALVVGIGINVHAFERPAEIADIAGSLEEFAGERKPRRILAARFLNCFLQYYEKLERRTFLPFYRAHSAVIGKRVTVIGSREAYRADVLGIDRDCRLEVRRDSGETVYLSSGEISIRL